MSPRHFVPVRMTDGTKAISVKTGFEILIGQNYFVCFVSRQMWLMLEWRNARFSQRFREQHRARNMNIWAEILWQRDLRRGNFGLESGLEKRARPITASKVANVALWKSAFFSCNGGLKFLFVGKGRAISASRKSPSSGNNKQQTINTNTKRAARTARRRPRLCGPLFHFFILSSGRRMGYN